MKFDQATHELIQECIKRKSMVFFSASGVKIVFQTLILSMRNDAITMTNTVPPEYIAQVVGSQQFFLKIPALRFVSTTLATDGVHLQLPIESLSMTEDNRSAKRFMIDNSDKVYIEVRNPIDQETLLRKSVMDLSSTGLSIRTPVASKLYTPGQKFTKIRIIKSDKIINEVDATVVYQQIFLNQKGKSYCQVGFKFDEPKIS